MCWHCIELGSNFVLDVDERSLPQDPIPKIYKMVTNKPKVIYAKAYTPSNTREIYVVNIPNRGKKV